MGHLINSTAMRLGWFSNWADSWFSNKIYYSEFLYNVLRLRLYLIYFFSYSPLEKTGYFYSHFEIIQKYNILFVNVFIYDGMLESMLSELFAEHELQVRKLNYNPMKRKPSSFYEPWKSLVVLSWCLRLMCEGCLRLRDVQYLRLLII